VGTIIRDDEIIFPAGETLVLPGDEVIVFALPEAIAAIEEYFD
jgi:trk system potassium uptake protein TrkA